MGTLSATKAHVLSAFLVCLLFSATIVLALATHVEDVREIPTAAAIEGWHFYPLALLETAGQPPPVYVLWLRPDDVSVLLSYPELRAFFFTGGARAVLLDGTLEIVGTSCAYHTAQDAQLVDTSRLGFVQSANCLPLQGSPTGDLKLVIRLAERRRISVGALVPIAPVGEQDATSIRVTGTQGSKGSLPVLRALYVEHLPPSWTRRVDLLAYMWNVRRPPWIWYAIGTAAILLFLGGSMTPYRARAAHVSPSAFLLRTSIGSGCIAAALGMTYTVCAPPFQAPDEPIHVLAFSQLTSRPEFGATGQEWSRRIHFDRIRYEPQSRFRPVDMTQPLEKPWKEAAGDNVGRSSNTHLWSTVAPFLRHLSMEETVLALRVINAAVFAVAVAAGLGAFVWLSDVPFPQMLAVAFFTVPTLPFFATHVSNYATLASAYVLFASAVLATIFSGRRGAYAGIFLGLSAAALFVLSRSAIPMALMLAAVMMGRLVIGERGVVDARVARNRALIFWGGLWTGIATTVGMINPEYEAKVGSLVLVLSGTDWRGVSRLWPVIFIAGALATVAADVAMFRLRHAAGQRARNLVSSTVSVVPIAIGACITLTIVLSLMVDFPRLNYVDLLNPPPIREYVFEAVAAALGMFRIGRPDFLTSTSFWVGFGWLDAIPPDWFTVGVTTLTAGALLASLTRLAVRKDIAGAAWLIVVAIGGAATFVLYAIATLTLSPDLHGRYLLGLYLTLLPLCWSVWIVEERGFDVRGISRWTAFFALVVAVHAVAVYFLLTRYF